MTPGVALLGGTAGVRLEAACRFAEAGARGVCLLGRDAARGERACAAVREPAPGADVGLIGVDARDERQVAAAVAEAEERLGGIDMLVTSTGPNKPPRRWPRS
jgi:NAD(P)-dependent dehydrogenase (short-subunit alcohol dehydrogenase family)